MGTWNIHWAVGLEAGWTCKSTVEPVVKISGVMVKQVVRD